MLFLKEFTMLRKISKKGNMLNELSSAPALILILVVIGIVGAIGLSVITSVGDSFVAESAAANATDQAVDAVDQFFSLLPTLGIIMIAIILLAGVGALLFFGFMRNR